MEVRILNFMTNYDSVIIKVQAVREKILAS